MTKNIKLFKIIKDYFSINLFKKKIKKQLNTNKFLSQEQVLIEFNGFQNFHISASYLANYLKNKYQCQLLEIKRFKEVMTMPNLRCKSKKCYQENLDFLKLIIFYLLKVIQNSSQIFLKENLRDCLQLEKMNQLKFK